jgi:DNA-directed RNA polymerase specialized sigma24 family protein
MPIPLTSESLRKLLEALSENEPEAVARFKKLNDSLIRFFELKGVSDADKAADETIDRVAEKLNQDTRIEDLKKFAFGVARFVYLERLRREQTHLRAVEAFYLKSSDSNGFGESDPTENFRECFNALYEHERELILRYFADLPANELFESRQRLAQREEIDLNALRNRISRLRRRLEDCLGRRK